MEFNLEPSWDQVIGDELQKPYFKKLIEFLDEEEQSGKIVYPPKELIFNAFSHTPYDKVRVVIMGQDPYHGKGEAHGLCFSVPDGIKLPPSLKNIFKEIERDLGVPLKQSGSLESWAKQGVLLLNATLTVSENDPLSHHKKGWEQFTDAVIIALAKRKEPIIFVLWGKNAIQKCEKIDASQHTILTTSHPSPFAVRRGFFGCGHFSKINKILGCDPIIW